MVHTVSIRIERSYGIVCGAITIIIMNIIILQKCHDDYTANNDRMPIDALDSVETIECQDAMVCIRSEY